MAQYKGTGRKQILTEIAGIDRERRSNSTQTLASLLDSKSMSEGTVYHLMTAGEIDFLSNIMYAIQRFGKLKRVFVSSWAIASIELLLLKEQCQAGNIEAIDIMHDADYVYQRNMDYAVMIEMHKDGFIRQMIRSRMHNKSILIETASGIKIVIVTSANCTFNPRIEIQTISINATLYDQYINAINFVADREMEINSSRQYPKLCNYVNCSTLSL